MADASIVLARLLSRAASFSNLSIYCLVSNRVNDSNLGANESSPANVIANNEVK